jgi:tRNA (guanosine-2'-O-)-methyltransferase
VKQLDGTGLKRLHRRWRHGQGDKTLSLILDNVASPYNVGAIVRTAAAYRVEHLWLVGETARPRNPKTQKTAMGTERYLSWSDAASAVEAIAEAREAGYAVIGLELADDATPLHELAVPRAACLVVGHEDRGLGATVLAGCDHVAYLPQLGRVGSLNAATAAAIALYECRRQGWDETT